MYIPIRRKKKKIAVSDQNTARGVRFLPLFNNKYLCTFVWLKFTKCTVFGIFPNIIDAPVPRKLFNSQATYSSPTPCSSVTLQKPGHNPVVNTAVRFPYYCCTPRSCRHTEAATALFFSVFVLIKYSY